VAAVTMKVGEDMNIPIDLKTQKPALSGDDMRQWACQL
jgi:hypothetical protein